MIYVDGIPLDYNDKTPVSFNVSWMDIRNITDIVVEGVVSITLSLPRTQKNHLALGHYSPLVKRGNVFNYEYRSGGNIVLQGKLRIQSRSHNEIQVILTSNNSDWIELFKTLNSKEIDLGTRLFNQQEYVDTLDDQSVVMYPFFKLFDEQFTNDWTDVHINNFKPAPNAGNFIRKAFKSIDYNAEFVGNMTELDKVHLYRATPSDAEINFQDAQTTLDAANGIGNTYSWGLTSTSIYAAFLVPLVTDTVVQDESNNISLVNFTYLDAPQGQGTTQVRPYPVYTSSIGASYNINVQLRMRVLTGYTVNELMSIKIKAIRIPFPTPTGEVIVPPGTPITDYDTLSEKSFSFSGHIGNIIPLANDFNVTLPTFVVPEGDSFMICLYFDLPSGQVNTRYIEVFKSNINFITAPTLVSDGLYYNVKDALPESKASAVLKSLIQNFNGMIVTKFNDVFIHNRDEWYQDEAEDWTSKVDYLRDLSYEPISDISKRLLFQYAVDSTDDLQEVYRKDNNKEYGSLEVELADDLLYGEQQMNPQIDYAPSMELTVETIDMPHGTNGKEMDAPFYNNYRMDKDRILYNLGGRGANYNLTGASASIPLNKYIYGSFEPLKFSELYPRFWQRTIELINKGEFVTAYVRLTSADIAQLNYRKAKLIRLDDGNIVKAWINRIDDLRPGSTAPTKIEFITFRSPAEEVVIEGRAYDNGYTEGYD
jgi:hypothetical protein